MAETDAPARPQQRPATKTSSIPKNHDEFMELQNAQIAASLELELAQQQSSQDEMDAIAADSADRANHNVVTVCGENTTPPERFDTLSAIEVYGEKGMARYEVAPGDTYLKIVMVNATHPEVEPVGTRKS